MSSESDAEEEQVPPPDFLVPGIRAGLEMVIVGTLVMLVGLPAGNALYLGVLALAALVAMVVVLFWALNQQMAEWVRRVEGTPRFEDESYL